MVVVVLKKTLKKASGGSLGEVLAMGGTASRKLPCGHCMAEGNSSEIILAIKAKLLCENNLSDLLKAKVSKIQFTGLLFQNFYVRQLINISKLLLRAPD